MTTLTGLASKNILNMQINQEDTLHIIYVKRLKDKLEFFLKKLKDQQKQVNTSMFLWNIKKNQEPDFRVLQDNK